MSFPRIRSGIRVKSGLHVGQRIDTPSVIYPDANGAGRDMERLGCVLTVLGFAAACLAGIWAWMTMGAP